jgi:hypothetical protein
MDAAPYGPALLALGLLILLGESAAAVLVWARRRRR